MIKRKQLVTIEYDLDSTDEIENGLEPPHGVSYTNEFKVEHTTHLAVLLKTTDNKKLWLPKSALEKATQLSRKYYLKEWFYKKMNKDQLNCFEIK
jgi:hypothetical protein